MRIPTKRILAVVLVVPILAALSLAYREYDERRMIYEEEMLKNLEMGPIEFTDASLDTALRIIVERIHARGHPEVKLHIYSDTRQVPYFHALRNGPPSLGPLDGMTFHLGSGKGESLPLRELLKYVEVLSGSTCDLRGHDLVSVPSVGTMERFRKLKFKCPRDIFDQLFPNDDFAAWTQSNGIKFYDGMTMEFKRKDAEVEIYWPASELSQFGDLADQRNWYEKLGDATRYWRMRLLGF